MSTAAVHCAMRVTLHTTRVSRPLSPRLTRVMGIRLGVCGCGFAVCLRDAAGDDGGIVMNPGDIRAKLPFVSQYFHEGTKWFFIDAHGQVQGPFSAENMTNWYKAGYFWNKDLLICHEGWDEYVTIESIVQSCASVVSAPPREPRRNATWRTRGACCVTWP